ncbi:MAG: type II toxin-antitoxin system PemK/MazF family toxin [Deltaproteobacteria bacterium]|nr:type II toxin-antitoxin system PemK/MazF family toxin [Deltaproteobacteria bacterium]
MPITFFPDAGTLLICDFVGFKPPEMVKKRPVVVISGRHRRDRLVTIVPLSTTAPVPIHDHHHQMDSRSLPGHLANSPTWAKCDMVATVGHWRLDRIKIRDASGKRIYMAPKVTDEDFAAILRGVLCAINLKALTIHVR